MTGPTVVMAAGGTGGHLLPALAIADAMRRLEPDVSISFVGAGRGIEAGLIQRAGYRAWSTSVRPLTRDLRGILGPVSMLPATAQARRILRREGARVVVGMGGYPSLPVVAAARLSRIPALIHEANAVAGLANEWGARMTPHVAVSFPGALKAFPGRQPRLVGMPLRDEIASLDRASARAGALRFFDLGSSRRTVLVFGGSLGAARLNAAAADLALAWRDRNDVQLLLATGAAHIDAMRARMPAPGALIARAHPYIERMDLAYAAADVVVARAGASTVAELAVLGLPAILIPLPHARRREQHANARALAEPGGALILEDADLTADRLASVLDDVLEPSALLRMAKAAEGIAKPDAAADMARWALALAEKTHE